MSESKHSMKLRHKAELKALLSQSAKGLGAKKKQKDDEKAMVEKHEKELRELDAKLSQASDESNQSTNQSNEQTENQPIEQASTSDSQSINQPINQSIPKSRAQLKRDKKSEKEKARHAELVDMTAGMIDLRGEENRKLSINLSLTGLQVREVLSDGHCLFRAVSDQLELIDQPHRSHESLRIEAAKHILAHSDDYQPFLCSEDGEPFSQSQAQQYCQDLQRLVDDVIWGGHAEIVALSDLLHHPIIVHSAEGNDLRVNGMIDQANDAQPLHISFHKHYYGLGNHYNSCVPVVAEDSDNEAE